MSTIRLLIVDDHPVVRAGIRGMLAGQPDFEVAGEASNGEEAVALCNRLRPNVVLMDLRMPQTDGVSAIKRIRKQWPDVHVLVLTTYDSDADILRAVEAGATGYLLKDAPLDELHRAIRAAARGEAVLAPPIAAKLMQQMRSPGEERLSGRELEILMLVADGKSNKEIARHLHISQATVKSHLLNIYEKLGVSDRTAAVTETLRRGYIRLT
ncbi:MAG: response regulator transcription factor [Chloroflexi bacterium]|nr:response regulator transcription factor [Chloroflexota bacterium]